MEEKTQSMLPIILVVFIDLLGLGLAIPILAPMFFDVQHGVLPAGFSTEMRGILLGLIIAIYPLAQFFGAPIIGALSDHKGRKPVLLISLSGTLLGYLVFAAGVLIGNVPMLYIGRMIAGFTGGNLATAYSAIADISDEKSKTKNFGLVGMAYGVGFIIGPYVGGVLSDPSVVSWFNFSTPFLAAALLAVINLFMVYFRFEETLKTRVHTPVTPWMGFANLKKAAILPKLRTMFIVIFLYMFGYTMYTQFLSVYLIERFAFSTSHIGDIYAFIGLCIALTQGLVTRPVSRWFSSEQVLQVSFLGLSIAVGAVLLATDASHVYFFIPFVALFAGLTYPNTTTIVSNLAGRESQGEIMGISQSVQAAAQAIPPIIAGVIISIGVTLPILCASAIIFCAWAGFMLAMHYKQREKFHEV
ncbi:MAG: MFS transporter [Candidatus Micrarchaeota archaeon]|nr:MFS transporter [Candidatus Micrarchaeota archaeon]